MHHAGYGVASAAAGVARRSVASLGHVYVRTVCTLVHTDEARVVAITRRSGTARCVVRFELTSASSCVRGVRRRDSCARSGPRMGEERVRAAHSSTLRLQSGAGIDNETQSERHTSSDLNPSNPGNRT